jgi:hypothetical protein
MSIFSHLNFFIFNFVINKCKEVKKVNAGQEKMNIQEAKINA